MELIPARIKAFADNKKISIRQIEQSIGASNGLLSKSISKNTDILSIWVSKFIEIYTEINPNWLLTGRGEMLKSTSAEATTEKKGEGIPTDLDTMEIQLNYCQEMVKSKEKIIELLEETVALKDDKLKTLTTDNKNLKILLKDCRKKKNYAPPAE